MEKLSEKYLSLWPRSVPSLCPAHHDNSEKQGFRPECLGNSYIDREPYEQPFLSYPLARLGPVMGPYPRTLCVFGQVMSRCRVPLFSNRRSVSACTLLSYVLIAAPF